MNEPTTTVIGRCWGIPVVRCNTELDIRGTDGALWVDDLHRYGILFTLQIERINAEAAGAAPSIFALPPDLADQFLAAVDDAVKRYGDSARESIARHPDGKR